MPKQAPKPNHRPLPKWLGLTLLAILAVVALVVVLLAVNSSRGESPNAGTIPTVPAPAPEPEVEEEPEPEPEPEPAYVAPVSQRILVAGSIEGQLLRGWVGGCPDPAGALEVSFDGGVTWDAGVIGSVDARRLLNFDATGGEFVRMMAQNVDCVPQQSRSFVGGTSWELEPEPAAMWYIDPADKAIVHTLAGAQSLPCQAVDLSSEGERGAVLCSDSTVLVSADGASWSAPIAVPNGAAVGVVAEGIAVASVGEPECAGVRTRLISGTDLGAPGACLEVAGAAEGQTAIAAVGAVWHLWAGDSFVRSSDLGQAWG